jgi:hypothetical protein
MPSIIIKIKSKYQPTVSFFFFSGCLAACNKAPLLLFRVVRIMY